MGKKTKRFNYEYREVDASSQMEDLDRLLAIKDAIDEGRVLPPDDRKVAVSQNEEYGQEARDLEADLDRLIYNTWRPEKAKKASGSENFKNYPMEKIHVPEEDDMPILDMYPVRKKEEPVKMRPPVVAPVTEPVYEEPETEDDLMSFDEFIIIVNNEDEGVITVRNPYTEKEGVSINTFCLRGYKAVKDDQYRELLKLLPIMMAVLAGPALIIPQDFEAWRNIMAGACNKGLDMKKVITFTHSGKEGSYFVIYVMDNISRSMITDAIIPQLEEDDSLLHFISTVATLVTYDMLNPVASKVPDWVDDWITQSVTNEDVAEDFCRIVREDQSYAEKESRVGVSIKAFIENFTYGDIEDFMEATREINKMLKTQLCPENYVEHLDDEPAEVVETEEIPEAEEVPKMIVQQTTTAVQQTIVQTPVDDLFDDEFEDAPAEVETVYKDPDDKPRGLIIDVT